MKGQRAAGAAEPRDEPSGSAWINATTPRASQ